MVRQCLLGLDLQRRVECQLYVVAVGWAVEQLVPRDLPATAPGLPPQLGFAGRLDAARAVAQAGVADHRRGLRDAVAPRDGAIVRHLHVGQHGPIPVQDAAPRDALLVEDSARIVVAGAQVVGADDRPVTTRRHQDSQRHRQRPRQAEQGGWPVRVDDQFSRLLIGLGPAGPHRGRGACYRRRRTRDRGRRT